VCLDGRQRPLALVESLLSSLRCLLTVPLQSTMVAAIASNFFSGAFATPALPSFSLGGIGASVVDGAPRLALGPTRLLAPRLTSPLAPLQTPRPRPTPSPARPRVPPRCVQPLVAPPYSCSVLATSAALGLSSRRRACTDPCPPPRSRARACSQSAEDKAKGALAQAKDSASPLPPLTARRRSPRLSSDLIADPALASAGAAKTASKAAPGKIELYSSKYYYTCALGGAVACGATHGFVTPLDLVKCRKQVRTRFHLVCVNMCAAQELTPKPSRTLPRARRLTRTSTSRTWTAGRRSTPRAVSVASSASFSLALKRACRSARALTAVPDSRARSTGFTPTLIGYSMQGAAKYGFYEFFKKTYSDMAGPENAVKYKDAIFLAGSASAEFLADMALVPMETVKVRIQTTFPPFATGAVSGLQKVVATEGAGALFKSLPSLWGRQIPYTMMKFWCVSLALSFLFLGSWLTSLPRRSFEATVAAIYNAIGKPKEVRRRPLSCLPLRAVADSLLAPRRPTTSSSSSVSRPPPVTSLVSSAPSSRTRPTPWSRVRPSSLSRSPVLCPQGRSR